MLSLELCRCSSDLFLSRRPRTGLATTYIVVVVDSHSIQHIVLATEETTVTQEVSHRPIKCQTMLLRSHRGDNPLLRPTGIQIATKSCATLEAIAPTNIKTVHQTSLLHIESRLDRLGFFKNNQNAPTPSEHPLVRGKKCQNV